jgi:hypothetical protein
MVCELSVDFRGWIKRNAAAGLALDDAEMGTAAVLHALMS